MCEVVNEEGGDQIVGCRNNISRASVPHSEWVSLVHCVPKKGGIRL
jgi:hypothetical protein